MTQYNDLKDEQLENNLRKTMGAQVEILQQLGFFKFQNTEKPKTISNILFSALGY